MRNKKFIIVIILLLGLVTLVKYKQLDIMNYLLDKKLQSIEVGSDGYYKEVPDRNKVKLTPEYDLDNIDEASLQTYFENIGNFANVSYSGRLSIPKIYLNLPIFEGINNTHLLLGASEQTPRDKIKLGEVGNYILASHKMSDTRNLGFARINRLKNDDLIYATDGEYMYIYKVFNSLTVKNSDTKYINDSPEDKSIMTLYTCSKFGSNTDKVVVQAELQNKKFIKDLDKTEYDIMYKKK